MKLSYTYMVAILLFTLFSCEIKKVNLGQTMDEEGVFKSVITHSAGDSWSASDEFLPLPMNIADVNEKDVLLLSDRVKVGEKVGILPLGAVKLIENDSIKTYVIAIPSDSKMKVIDADGFDEFSTVYSSAKWIVEQYLVNRKGSNVIKLKSWENEKTAINYLLN
jgi:inorganic pyrophosphatase